MIRFIFLILISTHVFAGSNCEPDINNFIVRFSEDINFQNASIKYPLPISYLDMGNDPEPAPVYEELSESQYDRKSPIFPIIRTGLDQELKTSGSTAIVVLRKPDTGVRLVYTFSLLSGCWFLIRYDNQST